MLVIRRLPGPPSTQVAGRFRTPGLALSAIECYTCHWHSQLVSASRDGGIGGAFKALPGRVVAGRLARHKPRRVTRYPEGYKPYG